MNDFFRRGFKFVDLFAGIGGFHQALTQLNGECVYAVEISKETAQTYLDNYGKEALRDITKVEAKDVPQHDVLCAGFPCQSFSKAGHRLGFDDDRGNLFFNIIRILKEHIEIYGGPKYLLLENVKNLISHDEGNTWRIIKSSLNELGYNVISKPIIVSPHHFGIPQLRDRAIILAVKEVFYDAEINLTVVKTDRNLIDMDSIIEKDSNEYDLNEYKLNGSELKILNMWNDLMSQIDRKSLGFPIWSDEFNLAFNLNADNTMYPEWKQKIIDKNKAFYAKNKKTIDRWLKKHDYLLNLNKSVRKFEWQANSTIDSLYDGIIQFRPSGIRVKKPTEFPALVAMVHVPIIGKERRYITPREAANLQSFPKNFIIPQNPRLAYKQFGNSINVKVIHEVFKKFVDSIEGGH